MKHKLNSVSFFYGVMLVVVLGCAAGLSRPEPQSYPRYHVSISLGGTMQVTDNNDNKFYVYNINGDKLKLQATADLTNVGKDEFPLNKTPQVESAK